MKGFFLGKILRFIGQKMDGYKTLAAGLGGIAIGLIPLLQGVAGMLGTMFPDQNLPQMEPEIAWGQIEKGAGIIVLALGGLGLGGKAEKLKKAVELNEVAKGR